MLAADGQSGRPVDVRRDGQLLHGVLLLEAGESLPATAVIEVAAVVGKYRLVAIDAAAALYDWDGQAPAGTTPLRWVGSDGNTP